MVTPRYPADAARRAIRLALVLTDNDGVLTDGTVYVGPTGEQMKVYSVRDGMGVERLRERGIAAGVITRELPELIAPRAASSELRHRGPACATSAPSSAGSSRAGVAPTSSGRYIGDDSTTSTHQAIGRSG